MELRTLSEKVVFECHWMTKPKCEPVRWKYYVQPTWGNFHAIKWENGDYPATSYLLATSFKVYWLFWVWECRIGSQYLGKTTFQETSKQPSQP